MGQVRSVGAAGGMTQALAPFNCCQHVPPGQSEGCAHVSAGCSTAPSATASPDAPPVPPVPISTATSAASAPPVPPGAAVASSLARSNEASTAPPVAQPQPPAS